MRYFFTTLAIGQKYYDSAINFSNKLMDLDPNILRVIVSDIEAEHPSNTKIIKVKNNERNII